MFKRLRASPMKLCSQFFEIAFYKPALSEIATGLNSNLRRFGVLGKPEPSWHVFDGRGLRMQKALLRAYQRDPEVSEKRRRRLIQILPDRRKLQVTKSFLR